MKIALLNQQKNHPLHPKKIERLALWLSNKTEAATTPVAWSEVTIVLTDNAGITRTNCEYFGKNRPTDVISFRYDPIPGEANAWSGDLIINVDRAVEEGTARGAIDYELALYMAHGFDHLTGAEDTTPVQRDKMHATETSWLTEAETLGLLGPFFKRT